MKRSRWTDKDKDFLRENYPERGKNWCAKHLNRNEGSIRWMASELNLKQNKESSFFKDWQSRAAKSKVGKKRPEQAEVMRRNFREGKFKWTEERRAANSLRRQEWLKNNPHPKGMLGKKHSIESRNKFSKIITERWKNMSEEQKDAYSKRGSLLGRKHSANNRAGSSWKAGWRTIGGKDNYYRSAWEANFARYLEFIRKTGEILDWVHEPETFWFEGIKRGCMSYLVDFRVTEVDGSYTYYEVKGWMDARSKTKLARMKKYHPSIELILINGKSYKHLERQLRGLIPDWEK